MKSVFKSILVLFILISPALMMAQKSKTENKIVKLVDENTSEAIALLKKAVSINSGTMNFEGVRKVGELFKTELDKIGFKTELTSGSEFGRAGHLIATRDGNSGPTFLLIGHLDTVFETDSPFQKYSMLNDSIMNGPGVSDMKGGDVIIILAMKALEKAGMLDKMNIKIIMTGDEEKSGSPLELSKKALIEASKTADYALGFEDGDGNPKTVVVARRGSASWHLEVQGNPAHSSQIFTDEVGMGAIYETSRILTEFYNQLSPMENLTFNPGFIIGGTSVKLDADKTGGSAHGKTNVVAQKAVVDGDIRAISLEQLEKAKSIMEKIASNNFPKTQAKLTFENEGYPPLARTDGNSKLLSKYDEVSQDLDFGKVTAVNPRNAGAADISFTAKNMQNALDGLGLSGSGGHTVHETGDLSKVSVQAKRAAVLMYRIAVKKD